jgi:hypothetical protein
VGESLSFEHFFTIEGYNGSVPVGSTIPVISKITSNKTYTEGIIANDSGTVSLECFVNTESLPALLLPGERLEFQFSITNISLKNSSGATSADYRVFLKRRIEEFTPSGV